ncbi:hypothetical protein [Polynucleobacter sp. Fuers-14]|uniref:hypothetical protein n=1 Tax=Polynucleobacter sp. Fuers-14 TaxID=1758364 RepID=UPI001C0AA6C9|nr:hypothetical protein [Polynucleobacter sp. Fuers-14]MBU3641685.1 hypothetical protein [Polynucleobacter sp. Fuers-14]
MLATTMFGGSNSSLESSRIAFHRLNPDVSLQSYIHNKRCQLGAAVSSMQRIYLDQRFWIMFRDASVSHGEDKVIFDLLALLKNLVSKGKVICPISESVFIELLKQSDKSTRRATAQLIDELSLGISLISFEERVRQEICNSFYGQAGIIDLIPLQQLVWTKLANVLGETHPFNMPFSRDEELVIQKAFSDLIWNTSLVDLQGYIDVPLQLNQEALATQLNAENNAHQSMIGSYPQAFRAEFEGGLSLFQYEMSALVKELIERGLDFDVKLAHLNKKEFKVFSQSIPSLYIYAACHAAVRWNKTKNLCGNDLFDFHHAAAALGYCDVFLTEKPLAHMLSQRHLGLAKHKCEIFWSPASALNWLRENHS